MAPPSRFTALFGFDFVRVKGLNRLALLTTEAYLSDPWCSPALTPPPYLQLHVFDLCDICYTLPKPTGKQAEKVKSDLSVARTALMNMVGNIRQPGLSLPISKVYFLLPSALLCNLIPTHSKPCHWVPNMARSTPCLHHPPLQLFFSCRCINSHKMYIGHL